MSNVWRCRNCGSSEVPLNGREEPRRWLKCVFGVNVGSPHRWEQLTDKELQKLRENEARKKSTNAAPMTEVTQAGESTT